MPPLLRLTGVSKRFGGALALDGIDWEVRAGEVHCLVGENGSGKSTLIKIVAGVHAPDHGCRVEMDGTDVLPLTPARARALGVQVIFQDLSLFGDLSVAENIAVTETLGTLAAPVRFGRMRAVAAAALDRLGHRLPLGARVSDLPVAERQIVAICRGLASAARLVFMDEPTASLTRAEVNRLVGIVERLCGEGIAVVFVSHRLEEIVRIAERVTVMRDGRRVGTYAAGEVDQRRIGELMTGQAFDLPIVARDRASAPPLLEVRGLSRAGEYDNIDLVVREGEVVGLTGLLGAGRTELALSLFGMTRPERGTIAVRGETVRLRRNRDALDAGIAYVSEDRLRLGLNLRQSIGDNLVLAVLDRLAGPR